MADDICKLFGARIRKLRTDRQWSQEELAGRAEIDTSYLSEVESGKIEPCLRKLQHLARAFGISLSQLMRGV